MARDVSLDDGGEPVVRGVLEDVGGSCPDGTVNAGGEFPMVHVWIAPHECGPFAALDGIAGGQVPEGEEILCDEAHGSH